MNRKAGSQPKQRAPDTPPEKGYVDTRQWMKPRTQPRQHPFSLANMNKPRERAPDTPPNEGYIDTRQWMKPKSDNVRDEAAVSDRPRMPTNTITLSELQESLRIRPSNDVQAPTPEGLCVQLLPHQKRALAWMMWRENQTPPVGILADDMGLGKTITAISLILQKKNDRLQNNIRPDGEDRQDAQRGAMIRSNTSLIVVPATVLEQWKEEFERRTDYYERLRYCLFHGPARDRDPTRLAEFDVVLTTYHTIEYDLKRKGGSPINRIAWERIILDEAHYIKNPKAEISKTLADLPGRYRWCLTGTPIQNELQDLYSLVRFMKIAPLTEQSKWTTYITNTQRAGDRLKELVEAILLRRTKLQVDPVTNMPIVELPLRHFQVVELEMEGIERACYDLLFTASRKKIQQFMHSGCGSVGNTKTKKNPFNRESVAIKAGVPLNMIYVLVVLLRLRQACVHTSLIRQAIDMDAFKRDVGEEDSLDEKATKDLKASVMELEKHESVHAGYNEEEIKGLFESKYESVKIKAILSHLKTVVKRREKCVIVSQWTSVISLLEPHLKKHGIRYVSITGKVLPTDRQPLVNSFNSSRGIVQVMLLSLCAGGVGLNLVGGNNMFIVDVHWNPAIEAQACDRIWRLGQTKDCHITKFVIKDSIEQRVISLQKRKTQLADSILQKQVVKLRIPFPVFSAFDQGRTKLTGHDLTFLFDSEDPVAGPRSA